MQSVGQSGTQFPQSLQRWVSIQNAAGWGASGAGGWIASVGQLNSQPPQLMHESGRIVELIEALGRLGAHHASLVGTLCASSKNACRLALNR